MIRTLLVASILSVNVAVAAEPLLPEQNEVILLVKDGAAVYDPALNVLMAMQTAGCAQLDITPISYTWHEIKKEGCK